MIGKWLTKLYTKFNGDSETDIVELQEEIQETHMKFSKYKDASYSFQKQIRDNHFFPFLVYDKGEQKYHEGD